MPFNKDEKAATTDKVDRLMTHPVWGIPVFLGIMALVFFLTFTVGDFLKEYFQMGLDMFSGAVLSLLTSVHAAQWITSPDRGRHHCRRGRYTYIPAQYFHPVPCPGFPGGQRI